MAVDYVRALAAYKIGAEGGNANCQYQLGSMLSDGEGIESPDYEQALVWYQKAAAQDQPDALFAVSKMAFEGHGQQPSWRRARELLQRAIDLGNQQATRNMPILNDNIQQVTRSHAGNCSGPQAPRPLSPPVPGRPPHEPAGRGLRHHPP